MTMLVGLVCLAVFAVLCALVTLTREADSRFGAAFLILFFVTPSELFIAYCIGLVVRPWLAWVLS